MKSFDFQASKFEKTYKPYIIAEVGQAHDGSLGLAHAYIEASAAAGADAVKFQTHFAAEESTRDEPWRVKFSYQDNSRYEYWQRMEFTEDQWWGLKEHADRLNIDFISTPFSLRAVELLTNFSMPFWKVSSGDINNFPLLEAMVASRRPIVLSSGMSPVAELDAAVELLKAESVPYVVLQCTTSYPCPFEKVGLNNLNRFSERYGCPVGLSDHTGSIYAALGAVTLGASMIEVHVVFDKQMFGPDVSSSLNFEELAMLVDGSDALSTIRSNPVDKDQIAFDEMTELRSLFQKSVVLAEGLEEGTTLEYRHIRLKKPGKGISPNSLSEVIGKSLKRSLPADHFLSLDDLEGH